MVVMMNSIKLVIANISNKKTSSRDQTREGRSEGGPEDRVVAPPEGKGGRGKEERREERKGKGGRGREEGEGRKGG